MLLEKNEWPFSNTFTSRHNKNVSLLFRIYYEHVRVFRTGETVSLGSIQTVRSVLKKKSSAKKKKDNDSG